MRNRSNKLVYGVGVDDLGGVIFTKSKTPKFYSVWRHMLYRCYSLEYQSRFATYVGCTVCEEWKYLSNFKKWFDENYIEGFDLDKDILVKGNKIYSPDTSVFVPKHINYLRIDSEPCIRELNSTNQKTRTNTAYQARVSCAGSSASKVFPTIEEAKCWYVSTKKKFLKEHATRSFLANEIKTDVYLAIIRREF